jgi:hypothetical protein
MRSFHQRWSWRKAKWADARPDRMLFGIHLTLEVAVKVKVKVKA